MVIGYRHSRRRACKWARYGSGCLFIAQLVWECAIMNTNSGEVNTDSGEVNIDSGEVNTDSGKNRKVFIFDRNGCSRSPELVFIFAGIRMEGLRVRGRASPPPSVVSCSPFFVWIF
jgi:hypothetical protein